MKRIIIVTVLRISEFWVFSYKQDIYIIPPMLREHHRREWNKYKCQRVGISAVRLSLLDTILPLHPWVYRAVVTYLRLIQDWALLHFFMDGGGTYDVPPLSNDLVQLTVVKKHVYFLQWCNHCWAVHAFVNEPPPKFIQATITQWVTMYEKIWSNERLNSNRREMRKFWRWGKNCSQYI